MAETINPYLTGATRYRVTGAVVVARRPGNNEIYVYRNSFLPTDTLPSQIEKLVDMGMVEKLEGFSA